MQKSRPWPYIFLLIAIPVSIAVAIGIGSTDLSAGVVVKVILNHLGGNFNVSPAADAIVWQLRLPRLLLAFFVGGGLSIVGVAMQALVRNPLAEPYILGLSSGASATASIFYLGFLPAGVAAFFSLSLAAFIGSLGAMFLTWSMAKTSGPLSPFRLLLAGVAVSAFLGAITSFVMYISPDANRMKIVIFWLLGSFSGTSWQDLFLPAGISLLALIYLWIVSRHLDVILFGEEAAHNLGVRVERLKIWLMIVSAGVTAFSVAAAGAIGFVGLIIPHSIRFLAGATHRKLIPLSFLAGGLFLMWADVVARTILPTRELPIGILTALTGVPFFLLLLRKSPAGFK